MDEASISSNSVVKDDVKIGKGVKIWHFCNLYGCEIGDKTQIGSFTEIKTNAKIGSNCRFQSYVYVPEETIIEDYVFIGPRVTFTNDKYPSAIKASEKTWELRKIVVKSYAVIGAGATIGPGVTIGKFSLIGMGSVVTKDVPDYSVVFGNPAKMVGDIRDPKYSEKYKEYKKLIKDVK